MGAEADPALLYSTYGYGLYSGLHHPYAYGAYYRPYGGYHYLGKRSAEAEPKAEADPTLLYSTYGLTGLNSNHVRGLDEQSSHPSHLQEGSLSSTSRSYSFYYMCSLIKILRCYP